MTRLTTRHLPAAKREALWRRYWAIVEDHAPGLAEPILEHLALRHDGWAMTELGRRLGSPGRLADSFSQAGLCRRAWRLGYAYGAQHLAMAAFNRLNFVDNRRWLARAALAGDSESARALKLFETRLPHPRAGHIGHRRPYRKSDFD